MTQIADGIGRLVCTAIGGIYAECQTGQSVADIGYGMVLLIPLSWGVFLLISRATG